MTQSNFNFNRVAKKLENFDLGYMLIQCAIGGFEVLDTSEYICSHNGIECCCLYHCIERESDENSNSNNKEEKINSYSENSNNTSENILTKINQNINNSNNNYSNKLTIPRLIKSKFSQNFIDFICLTTSYDLDKELSFSFVRNHQWLTTESNNDIKLSIEELLNISKDYNCKKSSFPGIFNNPHKRLDKLCDNLQLIMPESKAYFKKNKISNSTDLFNLQGFKENINNLSKELGIDEETTGIKIKMVFDNYFASNNNFSRV